ncbi:hypothetical protein P154DRAFT_561925 [Amniculicola lignicola CBS 123094]|uniref:Azaphilone pigments biosynthesis cluster protein L N-terminal domain-containing protein n=1 Tax=Amniculicola lignicola CBS 123094 TaxID=1392246 RepID=A0A6A5WNF4_9PLEO|nr:hypothetical protein P154DRAFT_561925 [Amniculicola lignicola CBS 123094]
MDPVSIASAAVSITATSLKVAYAIYTFIEDVRTVDSNLKGLHDEVLGLSRVSDAIHKVWIKNSVVIERREKEDGQLWVVVQASLGDCDNTVKQMSVAIAGAHKGGKMDRFLSKTVAKAVRLNLKEKDIDMFRKQIHSHNNAMQSGLATIQICLQLHNNSEQASIVRSLDELRQHVIGVRRAIEPGGVYDTFKPLPEADVKIAHNFKQFVQEAESFRSSSSTLIEGPRSTVWGGSVAGDPLSRDQIRNIQDWIPPIQEEATPEEPDRTHTISPSTTSARFNLHSQNSNSSNSPFKHSRKLALVNRFYDLGDQNLIGGDATKAEGFLRKYLQYTDGSSLAQKGHAVLRLAYVCVLLLKPEDAIQMMSYGPDQLDTRDEAAVQQELPFRKDILAMAYWRKEQLPDAIMHAEASYELKSRGDGVSMGSLSWTLWFLSQLFADAREVEEAEAYRSFLPKGYTFPSDADQHIRDYQIFLIEATMEARFVQNNSPGLSKEQHGSPPVIRTTGDAEDSFHDRLRSPLDPVESSYQNTGDVDDAFDDRFSSALDWSKPMEQQHSKEPSSQVANKIEGNGILSTQDGKLREHHRSNFPQ